MGGIPSSLTPGPPLKATSHILPHRKSKKSKSLGGRKMPTWFVIPLFLVWCWQSDMGFLLLLLLGLGAVHGKGTFS